VDLSIFDRLEGAPSNLSFHCPSKTRDYQGATARRFSIHRTGTVSDIDVWSACAEHLTEEAFGWPAVESLPEFTIRHEELGKRGLDAKLLKIG
jgi:hypothetical protein